MGHLYPLHQNQVGLLYPVQQYQVGHLYPTATSGRAPVSGGIGNTDLYSDPESSGSNTDPDPKH